MTKKRQYVNLDPDPAKNHGREFLLSLKIKEKKAGDSEGRLVYLFVEEDKANLDKKWLASKNRTAGFHFEPPSRQLVTVSKQLASAKVKLSIAGGDKYKFLAGKKSDVGAAVSAKEEVEVWRKIFVRLGRMNPSAGLAAKGYKPCPVANLATARTAFDKAFVEIEDDGPHAIPYKTWITDIGPEVAAVDKGHAPIAQPSRAARLLFVDRIGGPALWEQTLTLSAAQLKANKAWSCNIVGGRWTWPPDKDWVFGTLKLLRTDGSVFWSTDKIEPLLKKKGGYKHPEGTVTQSFRFDISSWTSINSWVNAGAGKMQITLFMWTIGGAAQGFASGNNIAIGTRHPYNYDPNTEMDNTVIHELGHVLGLKVRWAREYDPKTGAGVKWHDNPMWYDNSHGGMGTHCRTGAKLQAGEYRNGSCAMLHYTTSATDFCDDCRKSLVRADLSKIGYWSVWPESWMAWENRS